MKRSAPDYFCTWLEQGRRWARSHNPYQNPIDAWASGASDMIGSRQLFGPGGMAEAMPERLRRNLIFLIDSGWDVPVGTTNAQGLAFGTLIPDDNRFPETAGMPVEKKLSRLVSELKKRGWKGVGIWVPAHESGKLLSGDAQKEYWKEKIEISRAAGITYWKVDWGRHMYDVGFRRLLTDLGHRLHPELWIEHALVPPGHLNDGKGSGFFRDERCLASAAEELRFSDLFRTYDCTWSVNLSVTMARAAEMMKLVQGEQCIGEAILNLESAPILAIGLGGTFGTMAAAADSVLPAELASLDDAMDNARIGYDEVECALNFRNSVCPFAVGLQEVENHIPTEWLTDRYELPAVYGSDAGRVIIKVPGAITRGLPLPDVTDTGSGVPMIAATRYQSGNYAISILPRAIDGVLRTPRAKINFELPERPDKIGIFGKFSELKLHWKESGTSGFLIRSLRDPARILGKVPAENGRLSLDDSRTEILLERS